MIVVLAAANALLVYDAWRTTDQGRAFLARAHAKLAGCAGCRRRKQKLAEMVRRVHHDAEKIVEEAASS